MHIFNRPLPRNIQFIQYANANKKLNNQHFKSFSCCKKPWSLSTTSLTRSRDFQSESHRDEIKTAKFDARHSSLHSFSRHWQCFNEVNNSVGDV